MKRIKKYCTDIKCSPLLGKTYKVDVSSFAQGAENSQMQKEVMEIPDDRKPTIKSATAASTKRDVCGLSKEEKAERHEEMRVQRASAVHAAREMKALKRFADKNVMKVTSSIFNLSMAVSTLKKMKAPKQIQTEVQTLLKDMKLASTSLSNASLGIPMMPQHCVHT